MRATIPAGRTHHPFSLHSHWALYSKFLFCRLYYVSIYSSEILVLHFWESQILLRIVEWKPFPLSRKKYQHKHNWEYNFREFVDLRLKPLSLMGLFEERHWVNLCNLNYSKCPNKRGWISSVFQGSIAVSIPKLGGFAQSMALPRMLLVGVAWLGNEGARTVSLTCLVPWLEPLGLAYCLSPCHPHFPYSLITSGISLYKRPSRTGKLFHNDSRLQEGPLCQVC